jgi:predicted nucleic-acid-binding Zn-ribbon protein
MLKLLAQPCPKCEATDRIKLEVVGREGPYLYQPKTRDRSVLTGQSKNISTIQAITCIHCSYVELYATEIDKLLPPT